jgi:hypothetical protein
VKNSSGQIENELSSKLIKLKNNSGTGSIKNSPSPESNKIFTNTIKLPQPSNNPNKSSSSKGLNIIPLKGYNSNREGNTVTAGVYNSNNTINDKTTTKLKDSKIPVQNLSPLNKNKLIPTSARNIPSNTEQASNDKTKQVSKPNENVLGNLKNKSPSPTHTEIPKIIMKNKI